ncbi:MAG: peptidoglycan DD-metalloendopeptidase family protein [Methyloligellaceae bacterium]
MTTGGVSIVTMTHIVDTVRSVCAVLVQMFPERQVHYTVNGTIRYFRFPRSLQIGLVGVTLFLACWFLFTTIYFVSFDSVLRAKDTEIARARKAQQDVLKEAATFNKRVLDITKSMEKSRAELLALAGKEGNWIASTKTGIRGTADLSDSERERVKRSRQALNRHIHHLSKTWTELNTRSAALEKGLVTIGTEMEAILLQHGRMKRERNRLQTQVTMLNGRLNNFRLNQEQLVVKLDKRTVRSIEEVEKVIGMTGLKIDRLLAKVTTDGVGGPLTQIALNGDDYDKLNLQVARLSGKVQRWHKLRSIVRDLPLVAPVDHYRMTNGFGRRRDPFNKRWSMHNGVDLAYHINSPVLSTARGRVVYSGWRGGYGWTIEIDHGMGVRTRYSHLRKVLVRRGQRVEFREKIGLLGNSGRSTGPHVHYEIIVDGKPRDPMNFITAGKYVFKG